MEPQNNHRDDKDGLEAEDNSFEENISNTEKVQLSTHEEDSANLTGDEQSKTASTTTDTENESSELEDSDEQLPGEFKQQLEDKFSYLVDADEVPAPEIDEAWFSDQFTAICKLMDNIDSSVLVIYGESFVADVSASIAAKIEREFSSEYSGTFHFRDIPQDDVLLYNPADEIFELFDRELTQGDNIRLNLQLSIHPKLCRWLIAEKNLAQLNTLISNKDAYLQICILIEEQSLDTTLALRLTSMAESFHIDWPSILINKWHDGINLDENTRQYLSDLFPTSHPRWLRKSPRVANKLCEEDVSRLADKSDEEKSNSLKALIQRALSDSQKQESEKLKAIVEHGWQKPLNKMLLAIYCCLSKRRPVRYMELRGWGYFILSEKRIRYPVIQQKKLEKNASDSAKMADSSTTITSNHQYVDADANGLWIEYFDELVDNCSLTIERHEEHGLIVAVANSSEEWLVEEFYRRYPGTIQQIYDYILGRNKLFPESEQSSDRHMTSISEANGFSQLLICVNSINSVDFPIARTLSQLLENGAQMIAAREQHIRANNNGKISRTRSEKLLNYVSFGIAFYIKAIRKSSMSVEEYKGFISEALNTVKDSNIQTELLINAFGLLADQKQFSTLDYMFEFLEHRKKQNILSAGKWWFTMRRVFAYHMRASLGERCKVLEVIGDKIKVQNEESIIVHMTYSRLWFDAIRADFSHYSGNIEESFCEIIAKQTPDSIERLLSYYNMVDPELVYHSVSEAQPVKYIANMMLFGLQSALDDPMDATFKALHDELYEIISAKYLSQVTENHHQLLHQNPLLSIKQRWQLDQTKAFDELHSSRLKIYFQYFCVASAEWASAAAGLSLEGSTQESLDTITIYLSCVNKCLESEQVHQLCAHWRDAANTLELLERETKRPDGASQHFEISYLNLKKLIRNKVRRYRKMAEYLDGLQQETVKDIAK
ncbi:hypothetical protein EXT47_12850 [Pseudoalteromonas sp. CO342X]|uniref:hypothetical protein n=1 Tax=Pseudoalteromonas sp. CO342X TaxID=1777270 RepID=UPI001023A701|nr:hypothetical protein [Pseudoalteromonas sp. CO342X]RZG14790.1 hypothetical protein EXT47_12850 [Pseudoalteromonas sp. CO342X]